MPKITMQKLGGMLVADNRHAVKILGNITEGKHVMVDVRQPRNIKNHRRFFAFLEDVFDMQEHFTEIEAMRKWLIMKSGRFITIEAPNGFVIYEPESMNFASMDETEFKDLFSDCINVVIRELELDPEALERIASFA